MEGPIGPWTVILEFQHTMRCVSRVHSTWEGKEEEEVKEGGGGMEEGWRRDGGMAKKGEEGEENRLHISAPM